MIIGGIVTIILMQFAIAFAIRKLARIQRKLLENDKKLLENDKRIFGERGWPYED